ncbi:class F sortase [Kitasatospora sp. NPDC058965]|uniref:class F sortase n=1 Tax=Kitasatospora sp. NPDC058965 TaxID=3346682 RepID=UPI00367D59E2
MPSSPPVRVRIPAIKVDAQVTGLGLDSQGQLTTPPPGRHHLAGWYRDGTAPGATGTSVIIGHVDDRVGPGVFYLLGKLHPGQTVSVTRQDHRTAVFTVDAVRSFPKTAFPSHEIYDPTGRAELRLITCGGHYDHRTGYQANTVVFAHLTSTA